MGRQGWAALELPTQPLVASVAAIFPSTPFTKRPPLRPLCGHLPINGEARLGCFGVANSAIGRLRRGDLSQHAVHEAAAPPAALRPPPHKWGGKAGLLWSCQLSHWSPPSRRSFPARRSRSGRPSGRFAATSP